MAKLLTGTRIYGTGTVDTQLFVSGTTQATSTNSGALQVLGGVGIAKDVWIGGTLYGNIVGTIAGVASTATNLAGGTANQIPYQSAANTTGFFGPGTAGQILVSAGTTAGGPVFTTTSTIHVGTANNSSIADNIKTIQRSTAATHYLTFVDADNASSTAELLYTDAGITYNPSTNALTISGDLAVNGANITTTATTFNLINATATTLNVGSAATTMRIGAGTGTLTIGNPTVVGTSASQTLYNTVATTLNFGSAATTMRIGAGTGTLTIGNPTVVGTSASQDLYNTVATTLNFGSAATTLRIGAGTGTLTIGNPTVVGTSASQTLYNTVATTINAFGAATALTVGALTGTSTIRNDTRITASTVSSSAASGALVVTGGTGVGGNLYVGSDTVLSGDLAVNGGDLTSSASAFNLLNSAVTNLNFAQAGTTISIGATTGNTTIRNILSLTTTTNSSASTNGALVVTGGAGIGGNLYVGGTIFGNVSVSGSITTATNISGGTAGQVPYQTAPGVTNFYGPGTAGNVLVSNGTGAPSYNNTLALAGTTAATNATSGALTVAGGAGINGALYTGGLLSVGTTGAFASDVTVGSATRAANSFVRVLAGDAYNAGFEAYGDAQGTGYLFVGQGSTYGGGMFYSGDGSPAFATGEVADTIAFYFNNAGVKEVAFSYPYNSTAVTFRGNIIVTGDAAVNGGDITTNQATFNLIDATATTVNFARAATSLTIGATTGNTVVRNNLSVTGNLTVNGTTTQVNSTVTNVVDPIILIGGGVNGATLTVDDNKDRGIGFNWHNGTTAKLGFIGYDDSTGFLTYIPDATITNEVVSGSKGAADIHLAGGAAMSLVYQSAANTTAFLPAGTSGFILQTNGTGVAPTWVSPAGLTAANAAQVATVTRSTNATHYLTFVDSDNPSAANETVYTNAGIAVNPSTDTLRIESAIGAADNVPYGVGVYDTTAMAANVGGQIVLGHKYTTGGAYTEGAIIKSYKLNATTGDFSSGLKFQVKDNVAALSTKMTLDPSGNLIIVGDLTVSGGQVTMAAVSTRDKYRVWSDSTYTIGMQNPITFGAINNDYAMTFQMSNTDARGFWWGDASHTTAQGAMALSTNGKLTVAHSIRVGFSETDTTVPGAVYALEVNGAFAATTKSFLIDHPTKPGMKLRYGSLEGPENGVYVRGRLTGNKIELPEYWTKLVDPTSITVNLTAIGQSQDLYVEDIVNNVVYVGGKNVNCFYTVFAERIDVEKLEVEIK
jgi:hypothetical protein